MERKEHTEKAMKKQGQKLKLGSHSQGNPEPPEAGRGNKEFSP